MRCDFERLGRLTGPWPSRIGLADGVLGGLPRPQRLRAPAMPPGLGQERSWDRTDSVNVKIAEYQCALRFDDYC